MVHDAIAYAPYKLLQITIYQSNIYGRSIRSIPKIRCTHSSRSASAGSICIAFQAASNELKNAPTTVIKVA